MKRLAINMIVSGIGDPRASALVRSVLARLPDGWDLYRTVSFAPLSKSKPAKGYAWCRRDEELEGAQSAPLSLLEGHHEQCWEITLYRPWLALFSDEAAR
jgi:hypothetical protein